MKVLMFGWEFPPHISGGLGTACYGLTRGLLHHGADIVFVIPKAQGAENKEHFKLVSADSVEIRENPELYHTLKGNFAMHGIKSAIVPYMSPEEFAGYSGKKVSSPMSHDSLKFSFSGVYGSNLMDEVEKYALVAAELAANESYDLIHAHDWHSFPAGIIAKKISGKPLIVHIHATEYDRSGDDINREVYHIEQKGMQEADKVIAVSEYTRQIIINKYHIAPEKVAVVHNGLEMSDTYTVTPHHPFKEKIVSYLGRVTYQKGPEYFIEAAAKVLQRNRNYRFVMAGSGDKLYRMIEKAAGLRLMSHFHFTGFLKGDDVKQMFAMSDLYIMPSVSEPFGISPLEAVRSGVPVIISRQSGVREVLKHATVLDFWDTDAMANAIYALTQYEGLARLMVREAQREVSSLSWQTQAEKIIHLYKTQIRNL